MRKYIALSVPVVFMCLGIVIGAHRDHSSVISDEGYPWLLGGCIAYIIIVPILLALTTRSR